MDNICVGIIGCGRTGGLALHLAKEQGIKIKGAFDPRPGAVSAMFEKIGYPGFEYSSYEQLVSDPGIDWVMVGSPNIYHCEQIVAAFKHGKHVFSEKPLATTIADCRTILEAHKKSGRLFALGLCMRYSSPYMRTKKLLEEGKFGKIISVDANENINPGHGAYLMANWRRNKELAGPHILEKCVHDLDMLNWLIGSMPHKVAAFGGNDMFVPGNKHLLDKSKTFRRLETEWDAGINPFTVPKTIEDNLVAIIEYYNGARVQFQATTCNIMPERRMYLHCTEGNCIVEQYSATLKYQSLSDPQPQVFTFDEFHDAHLEGYQKVHAEGDSNLVRELAVSMRTGSQPRCGGIEGMIGSVTAIMIDQARMEGKILDLDETWRSLGVKPE